MTDHKYPNEIASCHSMLKKRDSIIDELTQRSNAKIAVIALPNDELTKTLEENSKLIEELDTLKKVHDTCLEDRNTLKVQLELSPTEEERLALYRRTEQENEVLKKERDEPSPGAQLWQEKCSRKNEKIKLLEEKLAICDSEYKEYKKLQQALEDLLKD